MRTTKAPSPKTVLNIFTLPVNSPTEAAPLVVTEDGEDVVLEEVEVPELDFVVDDAEVVAVEFPEFDDDALDEAEKAEEELVAEDEAEEEIETELLEDVEDVLVLELALVLLELELEPPCGLRTPPCNLPADDDEEVPAAADWYEAKVLPEEGGLITPTIPL
jgi:hypothetical protein